MSNHTLKEIQKDIRLYNLKRTLVGISSIAAQIDLEEGRVKWVKYPNPKGGKELDIAIATHSLTIAAKVALYSAENWAQRRAEVKDIVRFQNWVSGLPDHFTSGNGHSVDQFMFQTAYQQFPFQGKSEWQNLGRVLTLFRDIPQQMKQRGVPVPFDLPAEFVKYAGMSIEQFIFTGMLIYGVAIEGTPIKLPYIDDANEKGLWKRAGANRPTAESVERFLELTSRSPAELKELIGDLSAQDERSINLDFQPLLTFPIVRFSALQAVVPIPKLLFDRITLGIFHDFADHLSEIKGANPFRQFFGDIFENYVRQQLELVFDEDQLTYETEYGPKSKLRSTPDWYVKDRMGDLALECKSSTFRLTTRTAADLKDLAKDLNRIAVDGIGQIRSKVGDVRSGDSLITTDDSTNIHQIISTYESTNVLGLFGGMIMDQLIELGESPTGFHLVPIIFLEQMCAYRDRDIFYKALDTLLVDDGWRDWTGPGIQDKFREALPAEYPHNPIMDAAVEDFLSVIEQNDVDQK